jgi:hypothetical protein
MAGWIAGLGNGFLGFAIREDVDDDHDAALDFLPMSVSIS